MVIKKGNKTDRTVMMEDVIIQYFKKDFRIDLKQEVHVSTGIVDLLGIAPEDEYDAPDVIAIEIKQASTDFYSGHGLNFVGSSNYIAVPSELVGFAIIQKNM